MIFIWQATTEGVSKEELFREIPLPSEKYLSLKVKVNLWSKSLTKMFARVLFSKVAVLLNLATRLRNEKLLQLLRLDIEAHNF